MHSAGKQIERNHNTLAHRSHKHYMVSPFFYFIFQSVSLYFTSIYTAILLVHVHKHTHFGFYPHVYSATVLPYSIPFSILLFHHLGHIFYIVGFYHILTHCIFCIYCVILLTNYTSRCYYDIQLVLLYTGCFTN
jgi:hypothetical protein